MPTYRIDAPRTERLLWWIDAWIDEDITEADIVSDEVSRATTRTEPIETWGSHLGRLRQLLRDAERLQPEAHIANGFLARKIETYASCVGDQVRRELGFRTVAVASPEDDRSDLDTGVVHGPAGRDIGWGLTPLPRYDWDR